MTNLSLDQLRKESGAFISESDFQVIELQYLDALKSNNLTDSEELAEQFIDEWIHEQEILCTFAETKDGSVKYFCPEGMEDIQKTTMELLNEKDMSSYHWENMCRSYWKIFEGIYNSGNIDRELLKNILSERTISHEQIFELQKTVKTRLYELLG